MNPVETQLTEYFTWLDSGDSQLLPVQQGRVEKPSRSRGAALVFGVAAAVVGVVIGLGFITQRRVDVAPGQLPDVTTAPAPQSTTPDQSVLGPDPETTALAAILSAAGLDMSRLPDRVVVSISDVTLGATRLCGTEGPESPRNEMNVAVNSAARRCFLDSYLIGAPAVLVLQGPSFLTPPGVQVWTTGADRRVTIDRTTGPGGEPSEVWTTDPCGRISTDRVGSGDPPESIHCIAAPLTLDAEPSEPPAWFIDRPTLPLCGYSVPPSDAVGPGDCFDDALADGERAEYVVVADDGRSVQWLRSLEVGLYERIDWQVSSSGVMSWTRSRCTRSDLPNPTTAPGGTDSTDSCAPS